MDGIIRDSKIDLEERGEWQCPRPGLDLVFLFLVGSDPIDFV